MAKAKKSESTSSTHKSKSTAAKKPTKSAGGSGPMINTDMAAQSAARMLLNRAANTQINTSSQKKESSTFKQMKDSLANPHLASMDQMLNSTNTSGSQPHLPHQSNQKGHSQTYNADVTKTGVPRRTPG